MIRQTPRSTRTDTLFPYTTLFRSIRTAYSCRIMEWILSNLGREPRTGDCYQYGIPWSSRLSDQRRWWNREGSACEAVLELASRCLATAFLSRGNCRHADLSVDHSPVTPDRRQRLRTSSRSEEHTSE